MILIEIIIIMTRITGALRTWQQYRTHKDAGMRVALKRSRDVTQVILVFTARPVCSVTQAAWLPVIRLSLSTLIMSVQNHPAPKQAVGSLANWLQGLQSQLAWVINGGDVDVT